jgi:hypothetical protein
MKERGKNQSSASIVIRVFLRDMPTPVCRHVPSSNKLAILKKVMLDSFDHLGLFIVSYNNTYALRASGTSLSNLSQDASSTNSLLVLGILRPVRNNKLLPTGTIIVSSLALHAETVQSSTVKVKVFLYSIIIYCNHGC